MSDNPFKRLDSITLFAYVIGALIVFQAIGLLLGNAFDYKIRLGPIFILIPMVISSLLGVLIIKKMWKNQPIDKKDIFAIILTTLVSLVIMFFLRDFVPEIFAQSFVQLQSMVSLG